MRKAKRIEVEAAARLHPNDWSSLEVVLVDCSDEGFRAQCDARVAVGDRVTLEVPGLGPAEAWVTWRRDGEFGAKFLDPLPIERAQLPQARDETVLARLLRRRAEARKARLWDREEQLVERIRRALPVRRS